MNSDYTIGDGISFCYGDLNLDVYNYYSLDSINFNVDERGVLFNFVLLDEFIHKNIHEKFSVVFRGVELLNTNISYDEDELIISEMGYKLRCDLDLSWLVDEKNMVMSMDMVFLFGSGGSIRVGASESYIFLPKSQNDLS